MMAVSPIDHADALRLFAAESAVVGFSLLWDNGSLYNKAGLPAVGDEFKRVYIPATLMFAGVAYSASQWKNASYQRRAVQLVTVAWFHLLACAVSASGLISQIQSGSFKPASLLELTFDNTFLAVVFTNFLIGLVASHFGEAQPRFKAPGAKNDSLKKAGTVAFSFFFAVYALLCLLKNGFESKINSALAPVTRFIPLVDQAIPTGAAALGNAGCLNVSLLGSFTLASGFVLLAAFLADAASLTASLRWIVSGFIFAACQATWNVRASQGVWSLGFMGVVEHIAFAIAVEALGAKVVLNNKDSIKDLVLRIASVWFFVVSYGTFFNGSEALFPNNFVGTVASKECRGVVYFALAAFLNDVARNNCTGLEKYGKEMGSIFVVYVLASLSAQFCGCNKVREVMFVVFANTLFNAASDCKAFTVELLDSFRNGDVLRPSFYLDTLKNCCGVKGSVARKAAPKRATSKRRRASRSRSAARK